MEELPVFVYGTLRSNQPNYDNYLLSKVTSSHLAYISGAVLYNFGPFPGLMLTGDANQHVQGELMQLDSARYAAIMADLDYLEDCQNQVYIRQPIEVKTEEGDTIRAWVYVVGPALQQECTDLIESGDWLQAIAKA